MLDWVCGQNKYKGLQNITMVRLQEIFSTTHNYPNISCSAIYLWWVLAVELTHLSVGLVVTFITHHHHCPVQYYYWLCICISMMWTPTPDLVTHHTLSFHSPQDSDICSTVQGHNIISITSLLFMYHTFSQCHFHYTEQSVTVTLKIWHCVMVLLAAVGWCCITVLISYITTSHAV